MEAVTKRWRKVGKNYKIDRILTKLDKSKVYLAMFVAEKDKICYVAIRALKFGNEGWMIEPSCVGEDGVNNINIDNIKYISKSPFQV